MDTAGSILMVDDQLEHIYYLKLALEMEGYQVFATRDGHEALKILTDNPIDLVISDVAMPRLNGYQLLQRIRENPHWAHIQFVIVSGRDMGSDIRFGKELGVDEYLTKPIEVEDLLAVVRGRLKRAKQLAQATGFNTASNPNHFRNGSLEVDFDRHRVWRNGTAIKLSAKEFTLLKQLALHSDEVVPLADLAQATHGIVTDDIEAGVLLRPLVRSLRRKLGFDAGDMGCIENVRGVGYRLSVQEKE